ncbi:MAG: hypothetical protein WDA19_06420, partial [Mariniphaga sp.]
METVTTCPTSTATILACQKIAKSFRENIYELSRIRKEWDPEYAASLSHWVNEVIEKYYAESLDSIDDKRYREWHELLISGLQSIKILRAVLKVDFKKDKSFLKDVFQKLGYNEYFSDAKNGDHLSLYKFLITFSENLDEETREKIVQKGVPDFLFDKIKDAARQIIHYRKCFETLESENELNNHAQKEVADIYECIQDICRIAVAYYQFDPILRDEFNFYKVLI